MISVGPPARRLGSIGKFQNMRILHVFDHSLPVQSGYVTRSLGIIKSQRARGWETIHLTTPRQPGPHESEQVFDDLTFHRTAPVKFRVPVVREMLEMGTTVRALSNLVKKKRPDILHAHSPVLNAIPAIIVGRSGGIPVVYEVRAFWEDAAVDHGTTRENALRYRISRALDTWAMRRADCVVPISEPLKNEVLARGIPTDRVVTVPNAVDKMLISDGEPHACDSSLREKFGISDQIVFGFIGSFYSYEGLDLLIEAAGRLREHGMNLMVLLVGGGPDEPRLRDLAARSGLADLVVFAGRVPHREVPRIYDLIDVLVFPRRRMRLTDLVTPLKPLEAMAQVKPVVASNVGGHRELIRDNDTGFLFDADDIESLLEALHRVVVEPDVRSLVARRGRRFVETERAWDAISERYAQIYERVTTRI